METVTDFIFLGSKITAHGDCSHKIQRHFLFGNYDKPRQYIIKQRHHFSSEVRINQSCSFSSSPVLTWELEHKESWALKNWCFWTVVLGKTLESPLVRRSNQSILKEISPEYLLEGLMMKLKVQYFGHLMWRTSSLEKTLMLGKIEGKRRKGKQKMRWLDSITNSMNMNLSKLSEIVEPGVLLYMRL